MSKRYHFGRQFHLAHHQMPPFINSDAFLNLTETHGFLFNPFTGEFGLDVSHSTKYHGFFGETEDTKHEYNYITSKDITPEQAAKNAKELVDEEEKLKIKAEKKKQKKMRQRERRRQEKLEKENANKDNGQQTDPDAIKTKPEEQCNKNNKTSNTATSNIKPKSNAVTPESSDCSDEEDDNESVTGKQEELDMNSWFVTNAAAVAKRKLEQKLKSDRKEKRYEISKTHGLEQQKPAESQVQDNVSKYDEETVELVKDPVTKSMDLAVIGNSYAQTGELDLAVDYFTQAIKHNPREFKLFGNRSFCYEKMQQYDKALTDADLCLSLNPTWVKGLYRKGKALVGLKRYYEAGLIYKEVLKSDPSCTDAAQELMRVQIMQLMDMGYTREQSTNVLIIHGTVEEAVNALSKLHGNTATNNLLGPVHVKEVFFPGKASQSPKVPTKPVPQNQPTVSPSSIPAHVKLFPVWVGGLVPALSESKIYEIFNTVGRVHSVKVLSSSRCAFINYTKKEDCERAIQKLHGYNVAGTHLAVRYPDKIYTHLGVSISASTERKTDDLPECYFWRTSGCLKNDRCSFRHVPEHKGIDAAKVKR